MHLQQTKRSSLATGGAQYYFHNLTDDVKNYLRKKRRFRRTRYTLRRNDNGLYRR